MLSESSVDDIDPVAITLPDIIALSFADSTPDRLPFTDNDPAMLALSAASVDANKPWPKQFQKTPSCHLLLRLRPTIR